jgi:integrase
VPNRCAKPEEFGLLIPAHLFRREGVFYFRWAIPANVRRLLRPEPRWEVRISLRSHDRRIATPAAFQLWQRALTLADSIVAAGTPVGYTAFMSQLVPDKDSVPASASTGAPFALPEVLAEILGTYELPTLQSALAALQNRNSPIFVPITGCSVTYYNRIEVGQGEFRDESDRVETDYHESNAKLLPWTVTKIIGEQGNNFFVTQFLAPQLGPKGGETRYQLAEPTHPVECSIAAIRAYRKDVLSIQTYITPKQGGGGAVQSDPSVQSILLSDAMARWVQTHTDQGKDSAWSPTTADDNASCVRLLIEIIGDKLTTDVTPSDGDDFRKVISTLPPRFRVLPEFANLEPCEAAQQNKIKGGKVLSPRSMEKYIERSQGFMQYCVDRRYATIQPFAKLAKPLSVAVKRKRANAEPRLPFDEDELKLLFESEEAIKAFKRQKQASRMWVPMLGLYTGARLSELTELRAAQVTKKSGLAYIDFREWDPTQRRLKSDAATRGVPIHENLIKSGFLAYADSMKRPDNALAPLFPDLDGDHKKGNPPITKFFNETLLRVVGIKTNQKVFHSFRHTVADKLKRANASDVKISAFMGHAPGGKEEWKKGYGTGLKAHEVTELLLYLDYPIDWSTFDALLRQKQFIG